MLALSPKRLTSAACARLPYYRITSTGRLRWCTTWAMRFRADEVMVKFTSRLGFLQYVPLKPIKWDIRLWALADPCTGYFYGFKIYPGQDSTTDDFAAGLGGGAILSLADKLGVLGKGHTIIGRQCFSWGPPLRIVG